jgi:dTDP-4-dehydrorhamnose reductase
MSEKTLIFGKGYIGSKVAASLPNSIWSSADISNSCRVTELMGKFRPKYVINCAGHSGTPNIDACEFKRDYAWKSNVEGPRVLSQACDEFDALFIHLSSGCLFRGEREKGGGWREHDSTRSPNYYLQTKAAAESFLRNGNCAIIRIRMPLDFRFHQRNLLTKIAKFRFVTGGLNSITVLDGFIQSLRKIIEERATGIFHCVNPEPITIVEIRERMIRRGLADSCFSKVHTSDLVDLQLVRQERSDAVLETSRLDDLGVRLPGSSVAIERALNYYGR